ncbi:MurR/RpiR family transcriptional regulator [Enterococcus sp. AD013-P3]|uniref:MurR/RpiR family transcriptional regulator n=1 Tax=Enterococcus sp. AD013-P3 TaxID=3411036 RepID=UPI003B96280D
MLIREKMMTTAFSPAEQQLVDFILSEAQRLSAMTVQQLADENYVHPSTLIRVAKKLGYSGWLELKEAYLREDHYLNGYFQQVDANLPFAAGDGITTIAKKMAALEISTIEDTLSLVDHDQLNTAKQLLLQAEHIKIFGSNANRLISQDFALKMNRIGKMVTHTASGEGPYEAYNMPANSCGLLISYTGENTGLVQIAQILKQQQIPLIVITSIGDNTLARSGDSQLRLTTRERLYSKIGNFSINKSVCYLLDLLYSCVFADNYAINLNHLIEMGERIDKRKTSSAIMKEESVEKTVQFKDSFRPN